MPRKRLIPLLTCLLFLFTGCTSTGLPVTESIPSVTLPPASVDFAAPIGDASLEYSAAVSLFLPSYDGFSLTKLEKEISFSLVRPVEETILRTLIAHAGNRDATSLGGDVRLSLYGANPVEVSRNVATVNLSASALQLDREKLYIVCQAIANTLTSLEGIQYVNVLVVDKPIGLDIGNTLPMGALTYSNASDLSASYEQLLSRRVAAGASSAFAPLSTNVALYFPLQNSAGLVCEARSMNFENQRIPEMVITILRELAAGPSDPAISSTELPLLADLLTSTPVMLENTTSGGRIIALDFAHNLDDMLEAYGITRRQCTASLCYTLSSFFPNVSGISLSINGTVVDSLMLTEEEDSEEKHVFLRSEFSELIYDYCTLYFADEESHSLAASSRAIPYHQQTNPRILLCELAKGPLPGDSRTDLLPVMPVQSITDTTILGFALSDHTLLVNFSPAFDTLGQSIKPEEEQLFAYALVNTLCMDDRVRNVCFFQSGAQFDGFAGDIYWSGLFYPLPVS